MKNPYQTYQQNSVNTATPGELTLMLYNGSLKFVKIAKHAIEQNNTEEKNKNIQKAQQIIQELMVTLDMNQEVSQNFMQIYDYLYRRLIDANIKNDPTILEEVEGFLLDIRDTWKEVLQLTKSNHMQDGRI